MKDLVLTGACLHPTPQSTVLPLQPTITIDGQQKWRNPASTETALPRWSRQIQIQGSSVRPHASQSLSALAMSSGDSVLPDVASLAQQVATQQLCLCLGYGLFHVSSSTWWARRLLDHTQSSTPSTITPAYKPTTQNKRQLKQQHNRKQLGTYLRHRYDIGIGTAHKM